jgi:hypothetical protein
VSILVLGCGLLILISFAIPFFEVPFGGDRYMQWLSGLTLLLGVGAFLRRERGPLAVAAAVVTLGAGALLLLTVLIPFGYALAMRLFMPD